MISSFNYVRTLRQRHAFNERELAYLINQRSHTAISRIEVGDRVPNLEGAFSLQVLFHQEPRRMFPGCYELVEDGVMLRVATFLRKLESKTDRKSIAKREFLENVAREDNDVGV